MAVLTHKCPNCDAPLVFEPEKQLFHCDYCLMDFTPEEMEKIEAAQAAASAAAGLDTHAAEETEDGTKPLGEQEQSAQEASEGSWKTERENEEDRPEELTAYSCPNCGAEILVDDTTLTSFCYYCHSPVVLQGRVEGKYLPDALIPFKISREEALKRFSAWIKKKVFVPKGFYNQEQIEKLSGVYFPYWDLDYLLDVDMKAKATNLRVWMVGDMRYTETKYYAIERQGKLQLDDVLKNALKKSNRELVDAVQPYDQRELKPFSSAYFSGFVAERRDRELSEFETELAQEVRQYGQNAVRNSITGAYNQVTVENFNATVESRQEHYLLFPVWTLTYRKTHGKGNKDKVYYYALNGQTGKLSGKLPVSAGKMAALFAAVALPVFALVLLLGYLL